jgi:uncharacterized MAPEG superfamily protein
VLRKKRFFINNHENIPIDIAVMTGGMSVAVVKGAEEKFPLVAVFFILYTVLRYMWLVFYACKINEPIPLRTLSFVLSKLVMFALIVITLSISTSKQSKD